MKTNKYAYRDAPHKNIEQPDYENESILQTGIRGAARSTARGVESTLGAPGDVASGGLGIIQSAGKKITGKEDQLVSLLQSVIPTSETFHKYGTENVAKLLPHGYLEPQNDYEKDADQVVKDIAGFASPFLGPLKTGLKTATKLAGIGNLASFAAKKVGVEEKGQQAVKIGSMLAASLAGASNAKAYKNELYDAAESAIPEGAKASATYLEPALLKVEKKLLQGDVGEKEEAALSFIDSIRGKVNPQTGEIPLESLWKFKKQYNERVYSPYNTVENRAATDYLHPVQDALMDSIDKSKSKYPEFVNNLHKADDFNAGIASTAEIGKFFERNIGNLKLLSPYTPLLLGAAFVNHPYLAVAGAITYGSTVMKSLIKHPEVKKYYYKTIKAALSENTTQFLRGAKQLDKALKGYENEEPKYRDA
jgi:hypothetical protein